jgi:hypothetical protein
VRDAWRPLLASGDVRTLLEDDDAVLFEVRLPQQRDLSGTLRAAVLRRPTTTLDQTPLAPVSGGALHASVTFPRLPAPLQRGAPLRVTPTIRNVGDAPWPGRGVWPDGLVVADVGWADMGGEIVGPRALGIRLPFDLRPGQSATVEALLVVPRQPGSYRLEVRLRQVDRETRQSDAASLPVRVSE